MKKVDLAILTNEALTADVFRMTLRGDTSAISAAGQFVSLELDGRYLRRPISVCNVEGDVLTLIYKIVGAGTADMSRMEAGKALDVLTGLGNGYSTDVPMTAPLLIGGGVGVPPLFLLAKKLIAKNLSPNVILGFNRADEVFYRDEFEALGCKTVVTTVDGSAGIKGFVTDAVDSFTYDYTFACGPEPMLRAVYSKCVSPGQFSFEERMGCGFGACMGCSCKTKYGNKRICKDGPVIEREEIIW